MSTERQKQYDIFFAGETLDGHDPETVRASLGRLFKADSATLDKLFSGARQRIKKSCDQATAVKFQKALHAAGAKVEVRLLDSESDDTHAGSQAPAPQSPSVRAPEARVEVAPTTHTSGSDPDFGLAPVGADVLRPEERREQAPASIDLSHLSLGELGERLAPEDAGAQPNVPEPHFDLAEVGSNLADISVKTPPPAPDVAYINLAPPDHDLSDCSTRDAGDAAISTDHLSVAETGSELLTASERHTEAHPAPDTSHITLDDGVKRDTAN